MNAQIKPTPLADALIQVIKTVRTLRAPNGCPWDRAQTHRTLRKYLLEEAYEVLEVIDQMKDTDPLEDLKIRSSFQEELGDLLMQVLLHSQLASETGRFTIADVAAGLNDKLIRRHPHVFGENKVETPEAAVQSWEKQKAGEKQRSPESATAGEHVLDSLPKGLPALSRSTKVIEKVSSVGFQWDSIEGPLAKLQEELQEWTAEIRSLQSVEPEKRQHQLNKVRHELGDVLFSVSNLAYLLKLNPEEALRENLHRFEKRFRYVESALHAIGKSPKTSNLNEMDRYWSEAKLREKKTVIGLTGGIGSGKSTVLQLLREIASHGQSDQIETIDADQLARDVMTPGTEGAERVLKAFGTLDRTMLRQIISSNSTERATLESILHPLIWKESERRILNSNAPVVIYDAALLIETGRYRDFDQLWVVLSEESMRRERLRARNPEWDPEEIDQIIKTQTTDDVRRTVATRIITNDSTLDELRTQVVILMNEIQNTA